MAIREGFVTVGVGQRSGAGSHTFREAGDGSWFLPVPSTHTYILISLPRGCGGGGGGGGDQIVSRFFEFYASAFYWGYEVVSIRTGQRMYASDPAFAQLNSRDDAEMLHIEDPFLLHRNLNCVLGLTQCQDLYNKFKSAHLALENGGVHSG